MKDITEILSLLTKVRKTGANQYMACCPAHNDGSPSLGLSLTNNNDIMINCFAGCTPIDVLGSIGLTMSDLFASDKPWSLGDTNSKREAKWIAHKVWKAKTRLEITTTNLAKGHSITPLEVKKAKAAQAYLSEVGELS